MTQWITAITIRGGARDEGPGQHRFDSHVSARPRCAREKTASNDSGGPHPQRSLLSSTVRMDVTIYPVLVFVLSFFGLALSAWIGVLFSKNRGVEAQVREDFGIILAATLTLLGLIVGFTFSMALG